MNHKFAKQKEVLGPGGGVGMRAVQCVCAPKTEMLTWSVDVVRALSTVVVWTVWHHLLFEVEERDVLSEFGVFELTSELSLFSFCLALLVLDFLDVRLDRVSFVSHGVECD